MGTNIRSTWDSQRILRMCISIFEAWSKINNAVATTAQLFYHERSMRLRLIVLQWTCHIILWTNVFFYTAVLIAGNISCKPYEKLWDKTLPGTCNLNNNAFDVASAAFNVISDILILILPQNVIWRLHLELRKRIGIAVIFAIGLGYVTPFCGPSNRTVIESLRTNIERPTM